MSKEAVENTAAALAAYEQAVMAAMQAHQPLMEAMEGFQKAADTHWTYLPYGDVAQATGFLGKAFELVSGAHKALDKLRKVKGWPEPSPETRDGGGGGKP